MSLAGVRASPVVLTDGRGNIVGLQGVDDAWAEHLAGGAAASLGGVCAGALGCMTGAQARGACIPRLRIAGRAAGRGHRDGDTRRADRRYP